MSENRHIQLARTTTLSSMPTKERLLEGEIALNYNKRAPIISALVDDGSGNTTVQQVNGVGRYQFIKFYDAGAGKSYYVIGETFGSDCKAFGDSSHAEGNSTSATGDYSHSEGYFTYSIGKASHAEGSGTTASGNCSHAEGYNTETIGIYSHAEGYNTEASGQSSHAEGQSTKVNGSFSHAEGSGTTANGIYSHAEGYNTETTNLAEHASGAYNISTSGTNQNLSALTTNSQATLFSVGNGINFSKRKNAFEIKWNGDIYLGNDDMPTLNLDKVNYTIDMGEY